MGVSTNGILGYGIPFDEDTTFPWHTDDYYGDLDEWWEEEHGLEIDWDGSYEARSILRKEFYNKHPKPATEVNYCHAEHPMYALCIPSTVIECRRGYPTDIPMDHFYNKPPVAEITRFMEFLEKYEIETDEEPRWLLMSYWG